MEVRHKEAHDTHQRPGPPHRRARVYVPAMRNWPLFDLRVRTSRLELRLPRLEDLDALADLAAEGIHDPELMPFLVPWTDGPPAERARSVLRYQWRKWGEWQPDDWTLELAVFLDGSVVGIQSLAARDFATLREFHTGSWLGARHQGQGIGTEMRAAVLHLGFAGLDAEYASSGAFEDNAASVRVSRKLGYRENGIERHVRRGKPANTIALRMSRADWERHRRIDVTVDGLSACREFFFGDAT